MDLFSAVNVSQILGVAAGLIFVFLLVSLFVSWVQEGLAALFSWRSKHMIAVLQRLLDPDENKDNNNDNELGAPFNSEGRLGQKIRGISDDYAPHVQKFFESPQIKSLSKPGSFPSFIDPRDFANYVMHYVLDADLQVGTQQTDIDQILQSVDKAIDNIADTTAKEAIKSQMKLAISANDSFEKQVAAARENIMIWFNTTMDRAGGWYKRKMQTWAFAIGLIVVLFLNIDAVGMAWSFYNEPALREFVIQQAATKFEVTVQENCKGQSGDAFRNCLEASTIPEGCEPDNESELTACILDAQSTALLKQLDDLPIGWKWNWNRTGIYDPNLLPPPLNTSPVLSVGHTLLKIIGLLITAYAVSFGSSFWFDILSKVVNMRLTGKKPKLEIASANE